MVEESSFWVPDHVIAPRSERVSGNTSAAKQAQNDAQAIRTLVAA